MRSVFTFSCAVLAATGCTLLVSTENLAGTGEPTEAGAVDGSSAGADAEAGRIEPDASPPARDAEAGSPCTGSVHAFCDDFDRASPPATGWTFGRVDPGSELSLREDRSRSAPKALFARNARRPASAGVATYATVNKNILGPWRRFVAEFDMYLVAPMWMAGDINAGVVCFGFRSSSDGKEACVSINEASITAGGVTGPAFPLDAWVHVTLDVSPAGGSVTIGAASTAFVFAPGTPSGETSAYIEIGILGYNQPAPEYQAYYDNLTFDFR